MLRLFEKSKLDVLPISSAYRRLKPVVSESKGSIVQDYIYEDYDVSVDSDKICSLDFGLANIMSVGGEKLLKPFVLTSSNVFAFADSFENLHYNVSSNE